MGSKVHDEMAKFAFTKVKEVSQDKGFVSLAKSFPSMIQVNGLCTAIAYLQSKNGSEGKLYRIISKWMISSFEDDKQIGKEDLLNIILMSDTPHYRIYTDEIMQLSLWIKRFAEGIQEDV